MHSHILLKEHAVAWTRCATLSVLLLYFSWAHTSDVTFLAWNWMVVLTSITLLEIYFQLSDRGFSWRISLTLRALERQWVPWTGGQNRAGGLSWGSCRETLWVMMSGALRGDNGRAVKVQPANAAAKQEGRDPTSNPPPASCRVGPCGRTEPWQPSIWRRCKLVALQCLGPFLCFFWMCKGFFLFWSQNPTGINVFYFLSSIFQDLGKRSGLEMNTNFCLIFKGPWY